MVTEEDLKLFEKILEQKSKATREERLRHIKYVMRDLGFSLSPDSLKEYILELAEEGQNVARHRANTLKLFIKEVVMTRTPSSARFSTTPLRFRRWSISTLLRPSP